MALWASTSGFSRGFPHQAAFKLSTVLHWSTTMETSETSLFDTSFSKYDPAPPLSPFRPSPISAARPLTFPMPPLIRTASADYCRELIGELSLLWYEIWCPMHDSIYTDDTKKFLQRVYENQHIISKDHFTRMTGKPRDASTWLVNYIKCVLSCKSYCKFFCSDHHCRKK